MCPLRFILVFFSAILAGYVAYKTVRSSSETDILLVSNSDRDTNVDSSSKHQPDCCFTEKISKGFWVFVEMASGKYLWRQIREMNKGGDQVNKSS